MEENEELKIGTLLNDMGRIAVITRIIKSGALETKSSLIKWRINYEIVYSDGTIAIIGDESLERMIKSNVIQIV